MSKLFTKTLSVILVAAMLLSCVIVNAVAPEETELVPSDEAYQYLWDQGFPREVVETLSAENIMEIYNGQYELESVSFSYGILTDGDSIRYKIDQNGDIVMDSENRTRFNALLKDKAKVRTILYYKFATSTNEKSAGLVAADLSANMEAVKPVDAVIRLMTNFYGMITVIHINASLDTMIKKKMIYSWNWNYNPTLKLLDQYAVAWSGDFAILPNTVSSYYCATHSPSGASQKITYNYPEGYFTFTPNCSMGIKASLQETITFGGQQYTPTRHIGNIQGNIIKFVSPSAIGIQHSSNAIGKYFHKTVSNDEENITIIQSYKESPDTLATFYYYN